MVAAEIFAGIRRTVEPIIAIGGGPAIRSESADAALLLAEFMRAGVFVIRTAVRTRSAIGNTSEHGIATMAGRTDMRPVLAASLEADIVRAGIEVIARGAVRTAKRVVGDSTVGGVLAATRTAGAFVGRGRRRERVAAKRNALQTAAGVGTRGAGRTIRVA